MRAIKALNPEPQTLHPVRTCVGCGAKKAPGEMLRLASKDGAAPLVDERGGAPGRGAYLCRDRKCIERAWARRGVERALKLHGTMPASVRDAMMRAMKKDEG